MYSYEITSSHILLRATWPNKKGFRQTKVLRPKCVSEESLNLICTQTMTLSQRGTRFTALHHFDVLKRTLRFARETGRVLPEPGHPNWRVFIYEHYIFHLTHPEKLRGQGDKEIVTLFQEWRCVVDLYKHLQQNKIVPYNIDIPRIKKLPSLADEFSSAVLDSVEEIYLPLTQAEEFWPKTYLVDKDLNTPTDKFLTNLQSELENRTEGIIQACERYWDRVIRCQAIGASLIDSIPITEIQKVLSSGRFYNGSKHIADPDNPTGLAWFLAVIDYHFHHTDDLEFISYQRMKEIPFLRPICDNPNIQARMSEKIKEVAGPFGAPITHTNETLNRLLGHISARDCAAAAAILIAENPKFTPTSLKEADYFSSDEKPIHYYNSDLGCLMWSVSKPRATARKASALPRRSQKVYAQVVRATLKSRWKLMSNGNPQYRKLFLTSTFKWVGMCNSIDQIFTTDLGESLYAVLESDLAAVGVSKKSFSLKRIRGTQALIAFLKEGTYQSVANTLGNSIAVVKSHYIPKWLMNRWNVRILRIFQTKLIVLATKDKPWQVEASDFLTKEDLFKFIINAAEEAKTLDPISISLRRYAAELTEDATKYLVQPLLQHKMLLKLEVPTFAAIFLFAEMHSTGNSQEVHCADPHTGLSADSILTLANLLHAAHAFSIEGANESQLLTNITGLSIPHFLNIYDAALKIKSELADRVITATSSAA